MIRKKYPPEAIGPPVTAAAAAAAASSGGGGTGYNLWSSQHSLRREHRRKFNRSLCGVLLAISIVLVILGILGIIGIAVYLGGECN